MKKCFPLLVFFLLLPLIVSAGDVDYISQIDHEIGISGPFRLTQCEIHGASGGRSHGELGARTAVQSH